MDPSKALDLYASRRDLLSSFLVEYTLLTDECPELTDLLTFDAYVHYCLAFYTAIEHNADAERLLLELRRIREQLTLPPDQLK